MLRVGPELERRAAQRRKRLKRYRVHQVAQLSPRGVAIAGRKSSHTVRPSLHGVAAPAGGAAQAHMTSVVLASRGRKKHHAGSKQPAQTNRTAKITHTKITMNLISCAQSAARRAGARAPQRATRRARSTEPTLYVVR